MHVMVKLNAPAACVAVAEITQKATSVRCPQGAAPKDSNAFNKYIKKSTTTYSREDKKEILDYWGRHRLKSDRTLGTQVQ
jgi:hypothetical protein